MQRAAPQANQEKGGLNNSRGVKKMAQKHDQYWELLFKN